MVLQRSASSMPCFCRCSLWHRWTALSDGGATVALEKRVHSQLIPFDWSAGRDCGMVCTFWTRVTSVILCNLHNSLEKQRLFLCPFFWMMKQVQRNQKSFPEVTQLASVSSGHGVGISLTRATILAAVCHILKMTLDTYRSVFMLCNVFCQDL